MSNSMPATPQTVFDAALPIAVQFIARWEGCALTPYQDNSPKKVWTIGYGCTWLPDGSPVTADTPPWTEEQAMAALTAWVQGLIAQMQAMIVSPIALNAKQIAAMASFAYNEGINALRGSHLLNLVNNGDLIGAAGEFPKWVYAGGRIDHGLVNRRAAEQSIFEESPDAA